MTANETGGLTGDVLRLETLSQFAILDTAPEQGFDDIVVLATQLCETPIALVSLVDRDRQWFKARIGFEPCETDLNSSVCAHALGRTEILEIADLTADARTHANPLVTGEPFIRFYAGAPLNTPDGQTLGTLCVIDHVPRPGGLTAPQRAGLRGLANQVMSQLVLRRSITDREAAQKAALAEAARLEAMIATQQAVAAVDADLATVFQVIVDGALRVIDAAEGAVIEVRDEDHLVYDAVSGTSAVHRGVRVPIEQTLSGRAVQEERPLYCTDTQTDPEIDHALARSLGIRSMVTVPVTRRGDPIGALKVQSAKPNAFSPRDVVMTQMLAGLVASAVGDVAETLSQRALREAEARYRQTFESATEFAVVVTDQNGRVTDWNTGAERIFGWSVDEMLGSDVSRIFTPEDRNARQPDIEMTTALRDGRASDERWHLRKNGSRFYASGDMMPLVGDADEHLGFVKILRDRTAQKRAEAAVEASERRYRELYDAIDEGFCILEVRFDDRGEPVDYRFLEANPAFERQTGLRDATGRWMKDLAPAHEPHWFEIYGRIAQSGKPERFEQPAHALGDRWFEVYAYPVGGSGSGQVAVLFNDVSDRKRAMAATQASEAKWRGLFETLQEGFILGKVIRDEAGRITDWLYEEVNHAWGDLVGISSQLAAGKTIRQLFPGIEDVWVNEFADVVETGEAIRFTRQVGAIERWYDGVCQPVGDDRFTVIFLEVTEHVVQERRQAALLRLGDELRRLRSVDEMVDVAASCMADGLAADRIGFGLTDHATDTIQIRPERCAPGVASIAGHYDFRDFGSFIDDLKRGETVAISDVASDERTIQSAEAFAAIQVRSLVDVPIVENGRLVLVIFAHGTAPHDWTPDELRFIRQIGDSVQAAIGRLHAEEGQRVLNAELAHRMKNTLAMVQAITTQTLRQARSMDEGRTAVSQRLSALGRAQDILTRTSFTEADVGEVVESAIAPHNVTPGRITWTGPRYGLTSQQALGLSLAVHELATNAAKYGALSNEAGRVAMSWDIVGGAFQFRWIETGGPHVVAPDSRGFGSRLIERIVGSYFDGEGRIEFDPAGVRFTLTAAAHGTSVKE